jgi:hypothetical protein
MNNTPVLTSGGNKLYEKEQLRQEIHRQSGDLETLVGTLSDAVQLTMQTLGQLTVALSKATTLAECRAAALPAANLLALYVEKIDSGEVLTTFNIKGVPAVMADIEQKSTEVATVLKASYPVESK